MQCDNHVYEEVKKADEKVFKIVPKQNDCYGCVAKSSASSEEKSGSKKNMVVLGLTFATLALLLGAVAAITVYTLMEVSTLKSDIVSSTKLESAQMNDLNATSQQLQDFNYSIRAMVTTLDAKITQVHNQQYSILQNLSNTNTEMFSIFNDRITQVQNSTNQQYTILQNFSSNNTHEIAALRVLLLENQAVSILALQQNDSALSIKLENLVSSFHTALQQLNNSILAIVNSLAGSISAFPANSCSTLPSSLPAGYYYILSSNGSAVRQYCPSITTRCEQTGRWRSVANLDMTNSTHQCFSGLRQPSYTNTSLCARSSDSSGCSSVQLPANTTYESVCGTVTAYLFGTPDAFHPSASIDSPYVEGVSITHGSPRQHIWTFAAAAAEMYGRTGCSCLGGSNSRPLYVGNDYFCDAGSSTFRGYVFYDDNRLWDGAGCGPTSNCCSFNTPPWFYKELPQNTSDNIELRLCRDSTRSDEDIALETVTIYVK